MSDTTKINKARVNGVLYDLGGSGGGTGGISGAYMAPEELILRDYRTYTTATIDPYALIEQLEKSGISVDENPFLDPYESKVDFHLGNYVYFVGNFQRYSDLIVVIDLNRSNNNTMTIYLLGNTLASVSGMNFSLSLRELILAFFNEYSPNEVSLPNYDSSTIAYITNFVNVNYSYAGTTLTYYIPDMTEFCEEVIIENHGGSN